MISPVAGAAVMLIPAPSTASAVARARYDVPGVSLLSITYPAATMVSPAAMTRPAPKRVASAALPGDSTTNTMGSGSNARPASSGE